MLVPRENISKTVKKDEGTYNGDKIPKRNPLRCQANKMSKSKSVPSNGSNFIKRWVSVYVCVYARRKLEYERTINNDV